jgi:putative ABC transport system permease protein
MFRIVDIIVFTLERIRQHFVLVFWVLVGITIAVTLALSLPLYVDAVYSGILESRLDTPPYAYRYRYLGAWNDNIGLADATTANAAIEAQFVNRLNLAVSQSVRYMRGGTWSARLAETNMPLGTFGLGSLNGQEALIDISAGEWTASSDDERIPLLLPETMLFNNGVQVGDSVIIQRQGGQAVEAYIAAMWRPLNENDPLWIFPPRFFDQVMLTTDDTLISLLDGIEDPIDEMGWYLVFDGSELRTSEIDSLLSASENGRREIDRTLPGIRLSDSPEDGLRAFNAEVDALTQQLFIIIMPVGGLVLYFVSLVAGLLVTRQQTEDVKLRSRGMSRFRVLTVHILMWAFIVGAALAISLTVSPYVVRLIGRTASFLDFTGISSVEEIVITTEALSIAIAAGLIAASSGLILAWRITQQNINSIKRVSIQSSRAWWQRSYLDLLAVGLAAYVLYTLLQNQGIDTSADTPFADPLTFIGPTLFALGLTLLFLRLLPAILSILAKVIGVTSNVPLLMALRELTRSMGRYRGTLLMTAFTLSLVGFTASMASTLDQSLFDVVRYRVGSELVVITIPDVQTASSQDAGTGETTQEVTGFNAPPILELLSLEEIDYLSRIGRYDARLTVTGRRLSGMAIGIDRAGLGGVTFMRDDYSDVALGNMLNELALNRTGIIISQRSAEAYGILIGQEVRYQVQALGEWQSEIRATVVGFIEYFPTVDPDAYEFFLITSIEPIFEVSGTPLPFDVWINLAEAVSLAEAQTAIEAINFPILRYEDPETLLQIAQAEPARRGVLGFLSIGFVASIVLTLIGAVIQSTASFQAQSAQLGSLRAMGMSGFSVRFYILILQGLIALSGVGSGTLIGMGTTLLFLPLFDFSGGLPPYLVRVAWDEIALVYGVFGAVLILVALFMSFILSREQLARVVKLGNI